MCYLWKPAAVCPNQCYITRSRIGVVDWGVLLEYKLELGISTDCGVGIFTDVLSIDNMFRHRKWKCRSGHRFRAKDSVDVNKEMHRDPLLYM